jgi:hypothetical protein
VRPTTDGSAPNQDRHSASLITTTRDSSSATGSRPRAGCAPSVEYNEFVTAPITIRSTRSPVRRVEVNVL